MAERLKYGEFNKMTKAQKIEHHRMLVKRYSNKHVEEIKVKNKYYYELYKKTRHFDCICTKCGNTFDSYRKTTLTCPNCRVKRANNYINDIQERAVRREERQQRNATILQLYKSGLKQTDISEKLNIPQSTISLVLRTRGMRKREFSNRRKQS